MNSQSLPSGEFFVSWYQCVTSYRPLQVSTRKVMPEEEMAESVTTFFLNRSRLSSQDKYDFELDDENISGDLDRDNYIQNNFL